MNAAPVVLLVPILLFILLLSVLWTILPFAIFGIKKRLDELTLRAELQLEVLRQIRDGERDHQSPPLPDRDEER